MAKKKKSKKKSTFAILKRIGFKQCAVYFMIPVVFIVLMLINATALYKTTSENVVYKGNYRVSEFSDEFRKYLDGGENVVDNAMYKTENMIDNGYTSAEIEAYYQDMSRSLNKDMMDLSTGVYGYVHGRYLDGDGWVPDEDFDPTSRPWYKEALAAGGEITYCSPYIDEQTGDMTMTIARCLSDGESIVAIDLNMSGIQEKMESLNESGDDVTIMIIDEDGTVAAHTDDKEIGKNYKEVSEDDGRSIAKHLLSEKKENFKTVYHGRENAFFSRSIGGGWYAVSATDSMKVFYPIYIYVAFSIAIAALGIISILVVITRSALSRIDLEDFTTNLKSLSEVYLAIYKINLNKDSFEEISCKSEDLNAVIENVKAGASFTLKKAAEELSDSKSTEDLLNFVDLDTIDGRMRYVTSITTEFLTAQGTWCRGRFIEAKRESSGKLRSLMFVVESIDEEKKTRDNLLQLSETDEMTGLYNRSTGANKIRNALAKRTGGMLILFDIDDFRSINEKYGYVVGDSVITDLGRCLKKAFSGNEIAVRLSGDEFAIFAPDVYTKEVAGHVINRLLGCLDDINVPELRRTGRLIDISVGAAFYQPSDTYSYETLYKQADKSGYVSKKQAGTHITFYGDTISDY